MCFAVGPIKSEEIKRSQNGQSKQNIEFNGQETQCNATKHNTNYTIADKTWNICIARPIWRSFFFAEVHWARIANELVCKKFDGINFNSRLNKDVRLRVCNFGFGWNSIEPLFIEYTRALVSMFDERQKFDSNIDQVRAPIFRNGRFLSSHKRLCAVVFAVVVVAFLKYELQSKSMGK